MIRIGCVFICAKALLCLIIVVMNFVVMASTSQSKKGDHQLELIEDSLVKTYNEICTEHNEERKAKLHERFKKTWERIINDGLAFTYEFGTLRNILSIIDSPDGKTRIINWGIQDIKGLYIYEGYVLRRTGDSTRAYRLVDMSEGCVDAEFKTMTENEWFGALYYDIVQPKNSPKDEYTLLGWDGNDLFTNKKIIDVLWFDVDGTPRFGKPVFHMKGPIKSRVIFEYTEQSAMKLRWDVELKKLVFDHLSPSKPIYAGHKEYYGSDFTFDALFHDGKKWNLIEDIDVRNPRKKIKAKSNQ